MNIIVDVDTKENSPHCSVCFGSWRDVSIKKIYFYNNSQDKIYLCAKCRFQLYLELANEFETPCVTRTEKCNIGGWIGKSIWSNI